VSFIFHMKVPFLVHCLIYTASSHKTASASITFHTMVLRQAVDGTGLIDKLIN